MSESALYIDNVFDFEHSMIYGSQQQDNAVRNADSHECQKDAETIWAVACETWETLVDNVNHVHPARCLMLSMALAIIITLYTMFRPNVDTQRSPGFSVIVSDPAQFVDFEAWKQDVNYATDHFQLVANLEKDVQHYNSTVNALSKFAAQDLAYIFNAASDENIHKSIIICSLKRLSGLAENSYNATDKVIRSFEEIQNRTSDVRDSLSHQLSSLSSQGSKVSFAGRPFATSVDEGGYHTSVALRSEQVVLQRQHEVLLQEKSRFEQAGPRFLELKLDADGLVLSLNRDKQRDFEVFIREEMRHWYWQMVLSRGQGRMKDPGWVFWWSWWC